jgi:hypothetical protein
LGEDRLHFVKNHKVEVFILKALKRVDLYDLNHAFLELNMPFLISVVCHL